MIHDEFPPKGLRSSPRLCDAAADFLNLAMDSSSFSFSVAGVRKVVMASRESLTANS